MSTILFFNLPASGHVNPSLPVVRELVRRGERLLYYITPEYAEKVQAAGAEFHAYPDLPEAQALMDAAGEGDFGKTSLDLLAITYKLLPFVMHEIERERPDLVIYDSLVSWGRAGAEKYDLKRMSFISTFVLNAVSAREVMSLRDVVKVARLFVPRLPQILRIQRRITRDFSVPRAAVSSPLMNTGPYNLVFTSQSFHPNGAAFDDRYCFVGASIADRQDAVDFTIDSRPVIYISLGTINNQQITFYCQCFEALHDYPAQIILSVGKQTQLAELGGIPANFTVRNFVAQLEVLKQADLFISHGGLNSVHESLYFGVPLIVIPQQSEQAIVARRVQTLGAGLMLSGDTTPAELRAAVEQVMEQRTAYLERAAALGQSLKEAGGYLRAADEVQALLAQPVMA